MQAADRGLSQGSVEEFQVPPAVVRQHDRVLLLQQSKGHLAETMSALQLSFTELMHRSVYGFSCGITHIFGLQLLYCQPTSMPVLCMHGWLKAGQQCK